MSNIPLNANVECEDGSFGESTTVILNPTTRKISHVVVQTKSYPIQEYLIPISLVKETSSEEIKLSCTKKEVEDLEPFTEIHYIQSDEPTANLYADYGYTSDDNVFLLPYATATDPLMIPVEEERIPEGELAFRRGAQVMAQDGQVGTLDEFLVDPESGDITHFVMVEGHLWGKKEIIVPVSLVDRAQANTVYLSIEKDGVGSLPVFPLRRGWQDYDASQLQVLLWTFEGTEQAGRTFNQLKKLHQQKNVKYLNAAVLVKDESGQTKIRESQDVSPRQGTIFGAVTGGLIGLLGGPAGAIIGAAAGAAAGRTAAGRIDMGFSDDNLAALKKNLQPGSSALVVLVEADWSDPIQTGLADQGGEFIQQNLVSGFGGTDREAADDSTQEG